MICYTLGNDTKSFIVEEPIHCRIYYCNSGSLTRHRTRHASHDWSVPTIPVAVPCWNWG